MTSIATGHPRVKPSVSHTRWTGPHKKSYYAGSFFFRPTKGKEANMEKTHTHIQSHTHTVTYTQGWGATQWMTTPQVYDPQFYAHREPCGGCDYGSYIFCSHNAPIPPPLVANANIKLHYVYETCITHLPWARIPPNNFVVYFVRWKVSAGSVFFFSWIRNSNLKKRNCGAH